MGHEGHEHEGGHREQHGHRPDTTPERHRAESKAAKEHKLHAPSQVATFIVTCSDSRSESSDESGTAAREILAKHNHPVVGYRVVKDDPGAIVSALEEAAKVGARAVIFNGGTGIGRRDSTIETLQGKFEKTMPGFGELFRQLSFQQIGSAAMMSRATAGTYRGMVVFALPGSPQAIRLALDELILPELGHAVRELTR